MFRKFGFVSSEVWRRKVDEVHLLTHKEGVWKSGGIAPHILIWHYARYTLNKTSDATPSWSWRFVDEKLPSDAGHQNRNV
jgi:hypothetical protein